MPKSIKIKTVTSNQSWFSWIKDTTWSYWDYINNLGVRDETGYANTPWGKPEAQNDNAPLFPNYNLNHLKGVGGAVVSTLIVSSMINRLVPSNPIFTTAIVGTNLISNFIEPVNAATSDTFFTVMGGGGVDIAYELQNTTDGGFAVAGYTNSFGAGNVDALLTKFSGNGSFVWGKTLGGSGDDFGLGIQEISNGELIVTGRTNSFGAGSSDLLLMKWFSNGTLAWAKTLGENLSEDSYGIKETRDGGLVITGTTNSFGAGSDDVLLTKFWGNGTFAWTKTIGGVGQDLGYASQETNDNGLVVSGYTASGVGNYDLLLTKLWVNNTLAWARALGEIGNDRALPHALQELVDGSLLVGGYTTSFSANNDALLAKFSSNGTLLWAKLSPGGVIYSIKETAAGEITIAGSSTLLGGSRPLLAKLSSNGTFLWSKALTGLGGGLISLQQTNDGFAAVGDTDTFGAGSNDISFVRFDTNGNSSLNCVGAISLNFTDITSSITVTNINLTVTSWNPNVRDWNVTVNSFAPSLQFPCLPPAPNVTSFDNNSATGVRFTSSVGIGSPQYFGVSVSSAGDVNGDSYADLLMGAYYDNNQLGAAYLVFGHNGTWAGTYTINSTNAVRFNTSVGIGSEQLFGISVSSAGDVNRDGYADLLIGAYADNGWSGAAYLIFGHNGTWPGTYTIDSTNAVRLTTSVSIGVSEFGESVSSAGDVNRDGFSDLLIGAWLDNNALGAAYLVFGHNGSWPETYIINSTNAVRFTTSIGIGTLQYFGNSVSSAGDVNKDGYADLLIGAVWDNSQLGAAYLVFGHNGTWPGTYTIDSTNAVRFNTSVGIGSEQFFGYSVSSAGDVNKDGYADLLMGAYHDNDSTGAAYLVYGHNGTWPGTYIINSTNAVRFTTSVGIGSYQYFGNSVRSAGDVNKDGYADLLIGAGGDNSKSGAVYLVYGHNGIWPGTYTINSTNAVRFTTSVGIGSEQSFGNSVSSAGDVNKDGYADLLIGANGDNNRSGAVYLVFGMPGSLAKMNISTPPPVSPPPVLVMSPPVQVSPTSASASPSSQTTVSPPPIVETPPTVPASVSPSLTSIFQPPSQITPAPMQMSSSASASGSPTFTSDPTSSDTAVLIGWIVGAGALGLTICFSAIAAGFYAYHRHKRQQLHSHNPRLKAEEAPNTMDLDTMNEKHATGEGHIISKSRHTMITNVSSKAQYALLNEVTQAEANALKNQTGVEVHIPSDAKRTKFQLGKGQFGKLRIVRKVENGQETEFLAVKKIKGAAEIAASENESVIQKKLDGLKNIMPLIDSVIFERENDQHIRHLALYQFMPLAGFGNGNTLAQVLSYAKQTNSNADEQKRRKALIHVAQSLLNGLRNMHSRHIYHCDFKPDNFVIDNKGEVYIIDFGCAIESPTGKINFDKTGDSRYFSPERFDAIRQRKTFDGEKNDAWTLGLTLLEILTEKYPFDYCSNDEKKSNWNATYFQNKLAGISELQNPNENSIWSVIRGLLTVDPKQRLTIDKALQLPVFSNDNYGHFDTASQQQNDFEYMKGLLNNALFELKRKETKAKEHIFIPTEVTDTITEMNNQILQSSPYPTANDNSNDKTTLKSLYPEENSNHNNRRAARQSDPVSSNALQTSGMFAQVSRTAANESEINRYSHTQTDLQQQVMNQQ